MVRAWRANPAYAVIAAVMLLNLAGWGVFAAYAAGSDVSAAFVSAGAVAYVLGMRHAFDADHLAAIDDTTRIMVGRGRRPVGLGLGFATGHSLVVLLLFVVVALAAGSAVESGIVGLEATGSRVAMAVAATFLLLVGVLNLGVLRRVWRSRSELSTGTGAIPGGGIMTRALGRRLTGRIDSGWHMVPVGFLFGLGMETASEVTLLGMSAAAGASGQVPAWALLSLPLLFAAGMSLFDTVDSLMMTHLYASAATTARTRLALNLATTALTAAIGIGIGAVYLAEVLRSQAGLDVLAPLAGVSEHFEVLGYAIVSVYVVLWSGALLQSRRASAADSPSMTSAQARPTHAP